MHSQPPGTEYIETHGADESIPWTVHLDSTPIQAAPRADSALLGERRSGDQISGRVLHVAASDEEWIEIEADGTLGYITCTAVTRPHPSNIREGDLPFGEEFINRWWGLPIDYFASDLVDLPTDPQSESRREHRLRAEAAEALQKMIAAMEREGLTLKVVSAFRSGPTQKRIFDRNIGRRGRAQRSSAPPGHSEHQLGATVDVADAQRQHVLRGSFGTTAEWRWLNEHAWKYGFVQSYTPENTEETGYIPEPWHWRYWGVEKAAAIYVERTQGKVAATTSTADAPSPDASNEKPSLRDVWGSEQDAAQ